jgi:MauM/NapG family ferredoxin protein
MPERNPVNRLRKMQKNNGWVFARKITQTAALLLFFFAIIFSRSNLLPASLVDFTIRLSPLAAIANLLSSKNFLPWSTLSLVVLLSSLFFGRAWCGWLCPMGTILDLFSFPKRKRRVEPPQNLRKLKYGLLIVILVSAILGNLTLLFFDPLTIFTRSTTLTILPVLDKSFYAIETVLIKIPFLSNPVATFDAWLRPLIFPVASASIQYSFLFGFFFIGIILLNLIAERFWCRYLCPLGALLGLPSKLALFQRKTTSACSKCGLCYKDCPTGTIDPQKEYRSDPSECTLCMVCLQSCKKDSTTFAPKWQPSPRQSYDPDRRVFLSSLGISAVSVALLSADWRKRRPKNFLLRPPGVEDENEFLSKCVRCGICMKVCPTQALQPDVSQSGIEGFWTPILIPRNGFCDYACNACGQNCPVQAIPPLPLAEKQSTAIGHAYIDHNRCLAWSDHQNCIVCEEMCPVPHKAITLDKGSFVDSDGNQFEIPLPVVDRERCIGCGTCENKCPVMGEAAIRVYTL